MRIDKKIKRYVEKNGNVFKNYKELCNALREDEKRGAAKEKQLERFGLYFSYSRDGHKYIIDKIYDDDTIRKNEKTFKNQKQENDMYARSKYRREVIEVLKKIIYESENKRLFLPMISIAIACGFFNESIKGTPFYKDYLNKRKIFKSNNSEKKYYEHAMSYFNYNTYITQIKNNAYKVLQGTFHALKENDVIDYYTAYFGKEINGKQRELNGIEKDRYDEIQRKVLEDIVPLYNEVSKNNKETITRRDILFYKGLREEYYDRLKNEIGDKLKFENIIEYYSIWFTPSFKEKLNEDANICTDKQYLSYIESINKKFVTVLKNQSDKKIKKSEDFYCEILNKSLCWNEDDFNKYNYKYYNEKEQQEQAYYNKMEIIENLVNHDNLFEIINLEEYRKQNHESFIKHLLEEYEEKTEIDDTFFRSNEEDLQIIDKFLK